MGGLSSVVRILGCSVVVNLLLIAGSVVGQEEYLYFRDTFNRPDSSDLNASIDGKSGTLGPLNWSKKVFGSTGTRKADILGNCLRMCNQWAPEGCIAWPDHNFTEPDGEFWVSTVIVQMYNAGDGRTAGFGVGQNLSDLTGATTVTPTSSGAPDADVYISYDNVGANRYVYIYTNRTLVTAIPLAASLPDRVSARFSFGSMTAGSALNYQVFLDGASIYSGSTVWSGTDENYISVCGNTVGDTKFDSFTVADALFLEDAEGYSVGSLVPSGASMIFKSSALARTRDEGTATPFGTTNQYIEINDNTTGGGVSMMSQTFSQPNTAVSTFSFDFYEPSTGGTVSGLVVGYSRYSYNSLSTAYYRIRATLRNGEIRALTGGETYSYSYDTPYRLYFVFNDTTDAVEYGDYGNTIEPEMADVWLMPLNGGRMKYAGTLTAANGRANYSVGFMSWKSSLEEIHVDNVSFSMGALVTPPPPLGTMLKIW